jgi:hypothetical protein
MKHRLIVAVPLIFFWACGGGHPSPTAPSPTPATPTIQALLISAPTSVAEGDTVQLRADAVLSDGTTQTVAASNVSWQASNGVVATISTTGVLSGLQAGVVDVSGSYQRLTSKARVTVTSKSGAGSWDY